MINTKMQRIPERDKPKSKKKEAKSEQTNERKTQKTMSNIPSIQAHMRAALYRFIIFSYDLEN